MLFIDKFIFANVCMNLFVLHFSMKLISACNLIYLVFMFFFVLTIYQSKIYEQFTGLKVYET